MPNFFIDVVSPLSGARLFAVLKTTEVIVAELYFNDGKSRRFVTSLPAGGSATIAVDLMDDEFVKLTSLMMWGSSYGHVGLFGPTRTVAYGTLVVDKGTLNAHLEQQVKVAGSKVQTKRTIKLSILAIVGVVGFIVDEININAVSTFVRDLKASSRLIAAAKWGWQVRTGGTWDHKVQISPVWGNWNRLGEKTEVYYYDTWSNIHYGYVGTAAGFSPDALYRGADAQQHADAGEDDEKPDKAAIREGIELFARRPSNVTIDDVMEILARHPDWLQAARERAWELEKKNKKQRFILPVFPLPIIRLPTW